MKRNQLITFAALGCLMVGSFASQSVEAKGINKVQRTQERRIRRNVRQGHLTAGEANALWSEQDDIRDTKRTAREDGHVSREERQEIRDLQRDARRNILLQSNDAQKNPNAKKYKE